MDIKDAYLHGTVGVVKSINLKENTGDTLTYTLADVNNTTVEILLPEATTDANGLLSKDDKTKIDNLKSAAYTESSDYAISKSLTVENLNDVIIPGFYNAGGNNSVTNSPLTSGIHFGL
jgi:RNA polymerase-interacting CarD/CdnL/TRCF family regulator